MNGTANDSMAHKHLSICSPGYLGLSYAPLGETTVLRDVSLQNHLWRVIGPLGLPKQGKVAVSEMHLKRQVFIVACSCL